MLRGTYSIITVTFALATVQCGLVKAETTSEQQQKRQQPQEEQLHSSILFHHKFWIRDTEFVERDNWRNGLKPCTLLEKIRMHEQSVVSMGDSMDAIGGALESNIRDFALAMDGVLLLEEDTFGDDPMDRMFVQYLSEHGECVNSESSAKLGQELDAMTPTSLTSEDDRNEFAFQPDSDLMSWFNPDNWVSALDTSYVDDWIPDSHMIPCNGDTVIFGQREAALWPTIEATERSKTLSFKVNFKPSESKEISANISVNNLRVARLKIGDQFYNQDEFEQLVSSDVYENILFDFNAKSSVLKSDDEFAYPAHSLLLIDESPYQLDGNWYCTEDAGCICGNEDTNVMETICSFHSPLDELDQPCNDPIQSMGYCNKICATSLIVSMDPMKFSEKFLEDFLKNQDDEMVNSVLAVGRRISDSRYEITFRLVPNSIDLISGVTSYDSILGRERRLAQVFYEKLTNAATKSFYGIRSITIRSSIDWKLNNRKSIFCWSFIALMLVSLATLAIQDQSDLRLLQSDILNQGRAFQGVDWLMGLMKRPSSRRGTTNETTSYETDSFVSYRDPNIVDDLDNHSMTEIALMKLETFGHKSDEFDDTVNE